VLIFILYTTFAKNPPSQIQTHLRWDLFYLAISLGGVK